MIGFHLLALLAALAGSPAGAPAGAFAGADTAAAGDSVAADSAASPGLAPDGARPAPDTTAAGDAAPDAGARPTSPSTPAPRPVLTLPEVRVERERALSEARRRLPTAFVTDLRAGAAGRALESVSEILEQAAGVRVVQYGGLGAFSTVSLRGAPPGHVAVYLDGVPLTSAAHGVVNLSDLPVTAVDRVEVYRGSAPQEFGGSAPGGAINLVTAASPSVRETRLTRGSFGTWEARGTAGARRGAFSALVHGGYQGSGGGFAFLDDNGTPANPEDDAPTTRLNNRFDATAALATLGFERGGVRARLREDLFQRRQGVPGLGADPALHTRLEFQRAISQLEFVASGRRWRPEARLRGSIERERSRFRDLDLELHLGRHDTDDRLSGENLSIDVAWRRLPAGLSIEGGGSLRRERAELRDAADGLPDPPPSRRRTSSARVGIQLRPLGDRVVLHAARRWDRIEDHLLSTGLLGNTLESRTVRELDSPQIGIRLGLAGGLELRANASRGERPPDFLELFGNQGSVLGNPQLVPEQAENWDAGAAWSGRLGRRLRGSLEWAHFESRSRDLILYVQNSPSSVKAQNVGRARIRGEELSLRMHGPAHLALSAAVTRQSSVDQGTASFYLGKRLPQRPEQEAYARLDWTPGRVGAALDVQFIGDNFLNRYNTRRVESRTLVGASLSIAPWREGVRLTLEGKNLGDARVADVAGFPLPGRSLFVSLHWRLGAGIAEAR